MIDTTNKPADVGTLGPLDRIMLEAGLDEQAAQRAQDEALNPPDENAPDPAAIWALIPSKIGALLAMAVPELKAVYNDKACKEWGEGMAAVSDKYGWDASETLLKWAPELMLFSATLPLAIPTYALVSAKLEEIRYGREERARARQAPAGEARQPMKDINEPGNFSEPV